MCTTSSKTWPTRPPNDYKEQNVTRESRFLQVGHLSHLIRSRAPLAVSKKLKRFKRLRSYYYYLPIKIGIYIGDFFTCSYSTQPGHVSRQKLGAGVARKVSLLVVFHSASWDAPSKCLISLNHFHTRVLPNAISGG